MSPHYDKKPAIKENIIEGFFFAKLNVAICLVRVVKM